KTAVRLISHFGSIDELYRRLDEIEGLGLRGAKRVRQILQEGEEDARRSRFLATIRCDLPIDLDVASLARGESDPGELKALAAELEFTNLLKEFIGEATTPLVARRVEQGDPAIVERVLSGEGLVALAVVDGPAPKQGELLPSSPAK